MSKNTLTLLSWNCYVANASWRVLGALLYWIRQHNPDVIVLTEANKHADVLRKIPGYTLFQEEPVKRSRSGDVDDSGDSAVLVRDGLAIRRARVVRMRKRWTVWSHRRRHTPRRYWVLQVRKAGLWKVRASHWPTNGFKGRNRVAFLESALRSRLWLRASRVPAVDVGDLNENEAVLRRWFGKRFTVIGHRIDLLIARHVRRIKHARLGKRGSDHYAQLFRLTA